MAQDREIWEALDRLGADLSVWPDPALAAAARRLALADRFGLSIGFHNCSQDDYLAIIAGYAAHFGLPFDPSDALEWSKRRGARSGRVAWQYVTELAGRAGQAI